MDDDTYTNQSNTNAFDSYPTNNLPPPTANELLYDDSTRRSSGISKYKNFFILNFNFFFF
jgi:hypothetical protein